MAVPLRRIRSRVAESVRRFIHSTSSTNSSTDSSTPRSKTTLFFWPSKRLVLDDTSPRILSVSTPDSSRSVSFEDAISWPFIDDDA